MSEAKPVFLIAGDRGNRRAGPDPLLRAVFDHCGVSSPCIAYVGAANGDDKGLLNVLGHAERLFLYPYGPIGVTLFAHVHGPCRQCQSGTSG